MAEDSYPPQVEAFHSALLKFGAILDIESGVKSLEQCDPSTYSLPGEYGYLPHALLRRTNGGLKNEALATTEIKLSRDEAGWLTIEYLSWWAIDSSRGGVQVQVRPLALPPKAFRVQLGTTLKLVIEHFAICPDDLTPMLNVMQDSADHLNMCTEMYAEVLGGLVRR
jgi:hypothetical protein